MSDRERLLQAIEAQEQLRGVVADEVIDAAVATLKAQLDEPEVRDRRQRRRQVSVLFADVAGFTALSEARDPEVVAELMNDLWFSIDEVIDHYGGRVDKHIGDAVMGVWGVEGVREDDAERAVRAALRVLDVFSDFRQRHELDIDVRAGVNTGLVLFGTIGRGGELSVTGDAVNVASRLEHAAPPGALLISQDTYRRVRGVFDVRPQPPTVVKGKSEPLVTYLVERAKPRSFKVPPRGVGGAVTEMIGRDVELGALRTAFKRVIADSRAALVTVIGEAGVGKSRLLDEFVSWVDLQPESVHYLRGRSLPGWETVPRGLLRHMLGDRCDIHDDDDSGGVVAKLRAGLDGLSSTEADMLGFWLGFGLDRRTDHGGIGGAELDNSARAHLAAHFRNILVRQPAVAVFEDLHWADHESLDVLLHLLSRFSTSPLLIVGVARPTFLERRPDWATESSVSQLVRLDPLTERATAELVRSLLDRLHPIPPELAETVVARSDGNPLHVEEIIKMLIDESVVITTPDGEWIYQPERLDVSRVPPNLIGVLQARLDTLRPSDLSAIQRAAVMGRTFWNDAVAALGDGTTHPDDDLDAALDRTSRLELIRRVSRSAFSDCDEFRFKHALLRDAAYETVLLRDRRRFHARAADWLERRTGSRASEHLGPTAEHRALAEQHDLAATAFRRAATHAASTGALRPAVHGFERALHALHHIDADHTPEATDVRIALARVLDLLGEVDEAERVIAVAFDDAREHGDPDLIRRAIIRRAGLSMTIGDWEAAGRWIDEGRAVAGCADPLSAVELDVSAAQLLTYTGQSDRALAVGLRVLESSRASGDPEQIGRALNNVGAVLARTDSPDRAIPFMDEALVLARASGNLDREAQMLSNKGAVLHVGAAGNVARLEEAIAHYERAIRILDDSASPSALSTRLNLAQAQLEAGKLDDAPRAALRALREAWPRNLASEWSIAVLVLAHARIAHGDVEDGIRMLGTLQADPRVKGLDKEITRIFDLLSIDPDRAVEVMAAGADDDLNDLVERELARARIVAQDEPSLD